MKDRSRTFIRGGTKPFVVALMLYLFLVYISENPHRIKEILVDQRERLDACPLWEGNVFRRVCLFTRGCESHVAITHDALDLIPECSKLFNLSPPSPTHGHVLENLFIMKHVRLASGCFASSGNTFYFSCCFWKQFYQQECIPVGCVPSAAVAVSWGVSDGGSARGCLPRGVSVWQGGVCLGWCTPPLPCGHNS